MGTRSLIIEILPSLVSYPLSDEEVNFLRDDIDFNDEPPPTDTNKFLHLAAEDMEVTSSTETVLSPTKIASIEGKLWLIVPLFAHYIDIFLMSQHFQRLPLLLLGRLPLVSPT